MTDGLTTDDVNVTLTCEIVVLQIVILSKQEGEYCLCKSFLVFGIALPM